ncbi:hypothetical protein M413DRAFT_122534 [Hebeloma cylindrosporum]|uniref:Uncharacterized protein n=1 Tax=Hebeloma cylindrosporum TaxID=76867 RepID=A0A0C3CGK2_HEBCY|nr:hypothetical protein M413DRAFT_122534 [Hebeloma cylindrosporum h7]
MVGEYDSKFTKGSRKVDIHPGVVLDKADPKTGQFPVAMISKKLPDDPPQAPIRTFYQSSGLDGNVRLGPPVKVVNAKPWKHKETGGKQAPMSEAELKKLRDAMEPHQGWSPSSDDNKSKIPGSVRGARGAVSKPPAAKPHVQGAKPHVQAHIKPARGKGKQRATSPVRNSARPLRPTSARAAAGKGKKPIRGKREFIGRRAVRSE